jgi:YkoP domain
MMGVRHAAPVRFRSTRAQPNSSLSPRVVVRPEFAGALACIKGTPDGGSFWDVVAYGARPGIPGGLLSAWWLWDRIAQRLWPAFVRPGSPFGLLKVRVAVYHGRPINLPDSTRIDSGATVGELHCDNDAVLNFARRSSVIYAAGRSELVAIANWVIESETYVEAIFGVTLLGASAARLGFHRRTVPFTRRAWADRLFMNGLLALYSVEGVGRLKRGRTLNAQP